MPLAFRYAVAVEQCRITCNVHQHSVPSIARSTTRVRCLERWCPWQTRAKQHHTAEPVEEARHWRNAVVLTRWPGDLVQLWGSWSRCYSTPFLACLILETDHPIVMRASEQRAKLTSSPGSAVGDGPSAPVDSSPLGRDAAPKTPSAAHGTTGDRPSSREPTENALDAAAPSRVPPSPAESWLRGMVHKHVPSLLQPAALFLLWLSGLGVRLVIWSSPLLLWAAIKLATW